jgi:beta-lactamase regulating signal transducer with metallopeptidase domain
MILSRSILLVAVVATSYVILSGIVSAAVALLWRAGWLRWPELPARARASRLAALRLLPAVLPAIVSTVGVLPAFLAFEPRYEFEPVGPILIAGSVLGLTLAGRAIVIGLRIVARTRSFKRMWLQSATQLQQTAIAHIDAYKIESPQPIVALVGIWRPALVIARVVIDACSDSDLEKMLDHERTHLTSHDNLKRLLMACSPDLLRLSGCHREIASAWHDAAEDAADDATTHGEPTARLDLAAVLLKVARLAPSTTYAPIPASSFIDSDGLERRVRRLVDGDCPSGATSSRRFTGSVLLVVVLLASAPLFSDAVSRVIHGAVETLVTTGAPSNDLR